MYELPHGMGHALMCGPVDNCPSPATAHHWGRPRLNSHCFYSPVVEVSPILPDAKTVCQIVLIMFLAPLWASTARQKYPSLQAEWRRHLLQDSGRSLKGFVYYYLDGRVRPSWWHLLSHNCLIIAHLC